MKLYILGTVNPYLIASVLSNGEDYDSMDTLEVEGESYLVNVLRVDLSALTIKAKHIKTIERQGYIIFFKSVEGTEVDFWYNSAQDAKDAFNYIVEELSLIVK